MFPRDGRCRSIQWLPYDTNRRLPYQAGVLYTEDSGLTAIREQSSLKWLAWEVHYAANRLRYSGRVADSAVGHSGPSAFATSSGSQVGNDITRQRLLGSRNRDW